MRRSLLLSFAIGAVCLAHAASAELKQYRVIVDEFSNAPSGCPRFERGPARYRGQALIRETGDGSPVLVNLRIHQPFEEDQRDVAIFTHIPGALSTSRVSATDRAAPKQSGSGGTSTTIDWGLLTGWTKTGFAFCRESPAVLLNMICPFRPGWPSGSTLVPAPSFGSAYDTGVWTFTSDMSAFNSPKFVYQTFIGGSNNHQWRLRGELVQIPALPLLGVGALCAGFVYLGIRAARGSRS